tara:strand:+ start:88 stop:246 length:159 start_codon:yes stop_codon:yes gene_type:complete
MMDRLSNIPRDRVDHCDFEFFLKFFGLPLIALDVRSDLLSMKNLADEAADRY